MKLIYVYDDKTEINKGRTKLENIRYFTGEMHPDIMIDMPYISRTDGRWLKDMLRASYF